MRLLALLTLVPVALGAQAAPLPSVTLPPELDRVLRDYESAWRAGDHVRLSTLFTEDGFILPSGNPPIRGRSGIAAHYQGQGGPLQLRALAFAAADSLGYIIGAYGYGAAAPVPDMGKFTLTLRRDRAGRWLIVSDMDNGNRRPGGGGGMALQAPTMAPLPRGVRP
jgi:ketosteroid isomerase-like protein